MEPRQAALNASRHLTTTLGLASIDELLYNIEVPMYDKQSARNEPTTVPVALPHEILLRRYASHPQDFSPDGRDAAEWRVESYLTHPITQLHGERVVPLTFYSDSTPYTNNDSFYSGYLQIGWCEERFLLFVLKKGSLCQCPCKGFCSLLPVLQAMIWSWNACAARPLGSWVSG